MKIIKYIFISFSIIIFMLIGVTTNQAQDKKIEYPYDIEFKQIEKDVDLDINKFYVVRNKGEAKLTITMDKEFEIVNIYNSEDFTKVVVREKENSFKNKITKRYLLKESKYTFLVETEDGKNIEKKDININYKLLR